MRFSCRLSPSTGLSLTFVAFLSTLAARTLKSRSLARLCSILIILLSDIIYGAHLLPFRWSFVLQHGHRHLSTTRRSPVCSLLRRTCLYAWPGLFFWELAFRLGHARVLGIENFRAAFFCKLDVVVPCCYLWLHATCKCGDGYFGTGLDVNVCYGSL